MNLHKVLTHHADVIWWCGALCTLQHIYFIQSYISVVGMALKKNTASLDCGLDFAKVLV
jgi:hypothetical protein